MPWAVGSRQLWESLAVVGAALAAMLALFWLGALAPLDEALRELRFKATDRAPSGQTVFVEIDADSLAEVGIWPWPRTVHAQVLDRLMDMGAAEVVFDIDFSAASTPQADQALELALQRAGGYALLAAFQQVLADGTTILNLPLPQFLAQSEAVLVNVDGDGTRLLVSVPAGLPSSGLRSVAAALAPTASIDAPSIHIDYGIDLRAIDRMSVKQLLAGQVDPRRLANKQVIVGASAVELRDFFRVPRFGVIPGPLVQLAATETLASGRNLVAPGAVPGVLLILAAAGLFVLARRRATLAQLAVWAALGMIAIEIGAWLALRDGRWLIDTAPVHAGIVLMLLTGMLHERMQHWREIIRQQARLVHLANHDTVTDALSRQALLDRLHAMLENTGEGSVLLVQLERLDATIAALGHEVGDEVVRDVCMRLERKLGHKPARIAHDVFAWTCSQTLTPDQQRALCHTVAGWLEEPYGIDGHSVVLDTRFGSSATQGRGSDAAELLRQADVALTQGRADNAKMTAYAPEQSERMRQRRLQDVALRQALERGEFFLLYQPQLDLASGAMIGVEALVRWQSPSLGMVSPADFIPLAEETGLIVSLGHWILEEACTKAAQWPWQGRLSVNVSSIQFQYGDVVASVHSALARSGFPAHRLDLELTESLFVDNDPAILMTLQTLRLMGIGIALDDFGTGYSSLSYLSRLPIDKLKIDQSFVRPLPNPQSEAIVETIVLMAKRLGKTLVAEGIETAQQGAYLAALGCEVGQGYHYGRPARAETLFVAPPIEVAA